MTEECVEAGLQKTGIAVEPDFAVPVNGFSNPLPYMVIRKKVDIDGSDNGAVRFLVTSWTVALFTKNRAPEMERKISIALAGVGRVEVERFPDGTPYQTNFEFTTRQILK